MNNGTLKLNEKKKNCVKIVIKLGLEGWTQEIRVCEGF